MQERVCGPETSVRLRDTQFITVRQVPTGIFMGRGGSEEFTA